MYIIYNTYIHVIYILSRIYLCWVKWLVFVSFPILAIPQEERIIERKKKRKSENESENRDWFESDMYIMKQDIIIHRCMTKFAAKDSVWAQTFLLETESNVHTRVAEVVNPWIGKAHQFIPSDTRYHVSIVKRYWSPCEQYLHK